LDPTFQGTTSDQYSKGRFRSRSRLSSEITSDLKHGTQSRQGPALSRTTRCDRRDMLAGSEGVRSGASHLKVRA
jgi:hypothetical protein